MSEVGNALKAAGEAVRTALVKPPCCMEGTGCEMPPCHCSQVAASAAVAAFHRLMAEEMPHMAWYHRSIAAAVEAAAREADHG